MNWHKGLDKKIASFATAIVFLAVLGTLGYFLFYKNISPKPSTVPADTKKVETPKPATPAPAETPVPEKKAVNEEIAKAPPKIKSTKGSVTGTTTSNANGTTTTIVSEGGLSTQELNQIVAQGGSGSTPYQVAFSDETGQNAALEQVLKDYLNNKLKWSNEISKLYSIKIQNAGDTGWEGQYAGSYTTDSSGKIVSGYGVIILNSYYHQSDPNFHDYMKLVLSHEYGHHYTLYHKWMDWNLPSGVRFPDTYYQTRPLSKSDTAVDYSLGWEKCEAEIIAEDYSYIYSGYGYHAMSTTFGYPSAALKSWLDTISSGPVAQAEPAVDNPPQVSISSPANGAQLSGTVAFTATASDDKGVTKVNFYVNDQLILEDTSAPYEASLDTASLANGNYTLKAVAYDISQSAEAVIDTSFNNQVVDNESPVVTFLSPSQNPYSWDQSVVDLSIQIRSTDNVRVKNIKIYINDQLVGEANSSGVNVSWPYADNPAGTYVMRADATDNAGNVGTASLTINKN